MLGLKLNHVSKRGHWSNPYMSVNWAIIGSDDGLSPDLRQAIIWNNADILSTGISGTNFSEIWIAIQTFFIEQNAIQNVLSKMAAILFRPQWVKSHWIYYEA